MTKPSNPDKNMKAKSLLQEGKTFDQIRELILAEFPTGISFSTLAKLKKSITPEKVNPIENMTPQLKNSIKLIFDEMWDNLSSKQQAKLMEKYTEQITLILEVLK